MIEVSHLSKSYGSRPAVQDLSFTVPDGQIYGLLGPNGAGKSTIMNILTGYLAPTEGEVKVAGFRLPEQAQQAKSLCRLPAGAAAAVPGHDRAGVSGLCGRAQGGQACAAQSNRCWLLPAAPDWRKCCPGSSAACPRATVSGWASRRRCWAARSLSFWMNPP